MMTTHHLVFVTCWIIQIFFLVSAKGKGFHVNGMTYQNPIIDSNIPDPSVLALPDGSGYVLVSTSNYAQPGKDPAFPIHFSSNLVEWELVTYVFLESNWP